MTGKFALLGIVAFICGLLGSCRMWASSPGTEEGPYFKVVDLVVPSSMEVGDTITVGIRVAQIQPLPSGINMDSVDVWVSSYGIELIQPRPYYKAKDGRLIGGRKTHEPLYAKRVNDNLFETNMKLTFLWVGDFDLYISARGWGLFSVESFYFRGSELGQIQYLGNEETVKEKGIEMKKTLGHPFLRGEEVRIRYPVGFMQRYMDCVMTISPPPALNVSSTVHIKADTRVVMKDFGETTLRLGFDQSPIGFSPRDWKMPLRQGEVSEGAFTIKPLRTGHHYFHIEGLEPDIRCHFVLDESGKPVHISRRRIKSGNIEDLLNRQDQR